MINEPLPGLCGNMKNIRLCCKYFLIIIKYFLTIIQTKPWAECYGSDFEEQSQKNRAVTMAVESILSTEN